MHLNPRRMGFAQGEKTESQFLPCQSIVVIGILLILIWAGFWFRLLYVQRPYFHPDEYVSMLTARMVAERGVPILPSGLWYDPEITFSYFSGLLVWLLGESHFAVRWASVFFGTLSIPMAYITARRILSSSFAGLAAATLLALAPEAVLWGGRTRRYAMAEFLLLLLLWLIWIGAVEGDKRKYRMFFYFIFAIAGLTYSQTLVVIPAALLAVVALTWRRGISGRNRILEKHVIIEAVIIVLISGALLWVAKHSFITPYATTFASQRLQEENVSLLSKVTTLSPFLLPRFDFAYASQKIRGLILLEPFYQVLALPALLAVILSVVPGFDKTGRFRKAIWFLLIIAGSVAFEFLFLVSEDWTGPRPRYLFVSLWPAYMMLACGVVAGLEILARGWSSRMSLPTFAKWVLMTILLLPSLGAVILTIPKTSDNLKHSVWNEINYHQAFHYVKNHWQPGDRVMTVLTTASYWYLDRTDYYARDRDPFVFENSESEMVDRWTGARWVSEPSDLDEIFQGDRIWFIIDASRLWNVYTLAFKQQLLARMTPVFQTGNVHVLLPRSEALDIPAEPEVRLKARLAGKVELTGYSLDEEALLNGGTGQLTLFWKGLQPLRDYKVFVHLRDHNDQTVAQADHIPSEELVALPTSTWRVTEVVPDVTYLTVPSDIASGEYRLMVGMYDPETLERLPVENDGTGENAVVITTLQRP